MTTYSETYQETAEQQPDKSSMSFLEHLDELRSRLIRSAAFVLVAFAGCWFVSDYIYQFLEVPVRAAMVKARQQAAIGLETSQPAALSGLPDGSVLSFAFPTECKAGDALIPANTTVQVRVEHLGEGQTRLVTTGAVLVRENAVVPDGFVIPRELYSNTSSLLSPDNRLVVPTVQGAFNLYIKVAFYAAIFVSVPFILVQVWGFVSPGLYPHEKRYALPFIFMASAFFVLGCAFAYYIAFPRAADFLLDVAARGNLRPLVAAGEYFDLILTIMLGLGLVFEIPTVTFFLSRLGLIGPSFLLKVWRFAVVAIFIIAALLSPTTDIPNLLVFAAPMLVLYFLSVGIAWVFYRKRVREGRMGG